MPSVYAELNEIQHHLEQYFTDMQDIEFTIQDGKLWMLQCRNGKRTGAAMVKIAMDMLREGLIDEKTAVLRCEPAKLGRAAAPPYSTRPPSSTPGHHEGSARIAGRRYGSRGVLRRRCREGARLDGPEGHSGTYRDLARGSEGYARRCRYPDRTRRHDLPRGRRRPRHGQVLRIGCRRAGDRLQGPHDRGERLHRQGGRLDLAQRFDRRGLPGSGGYEGRRSERRLPAGSWSWLRQVFGAEGARQCRHAEGCRARHSSSVPRVSVSAARSTCSSRATASRPSAR